MSVAYRIQPALVAAHALAVVAFAAPAVAQEAPPVEETGPVEAASPPQKSDVQAPEHKPGFFHRFIDEEDGGFDFSNTLAKGGFMPIPIIITEPAVDGGFGLAAAFLSVPKDHPRQVTRTAVAAFKTGNGSYGYGLFRQGYAFDGRLAYKGGIGRGKITLDAFPAFAPGGIEYTNHYEYGILASALWHFGDERFSAGPLIDFRKLSSQLDIGGLPPEFVQDFNRTMHTGAIGGGFHFDDRDNPLTPTHGMNVYAQGKFNRGFLGSDRDYEVYDLHAYAFDKFTSNLRFGFKFELDAIRGNNPSYFAPSISLRGVQAIQYQGSSVVSSEFELTWQVSPRWALIGFGGMGATDSGDQRFFDDSGAIWAGGAGFRYRIARKLGLDAGIDVAYGPGGAVFYLQFGHAWSFGMD